MTHLPPPFSLSLSLSLLFLSFSLQSRYATCRPEFSAKSAQLSEQDCDQAASSGNGSAAVKSPLSSVSQLYLELCSEPAGQPRATVQPQPRRMVTNPARPYRTRGHIHGMTHRWTIVMLQMPCVRLHSSESASGCGSEEANLPDIGTTRCCWRDGLHLILDSKQSGAAYRRHPDGSRHTCDVGPVPRAGTSSGTIVTPPAFHQPPALSWAFE